VRSRLPELKEEDDSGSAESETTLVSESLEYVE